MNLRVLVAAAAAFLAAASAAHAVTISGTYSATPTASNPSYAPLINDDGQSFVNSPFSAALSVGSTTTPTPFLQISPISGGSSVGTVTGRINLALTLSDSTAVTGVTATSGGLGATLSNGVINFSAAYELFYGNQTDCVVWNASSCTPNDNTTTIGETLAVTFADGAVLDVNLYNWSDWNMAPDVSFGLAAGPTTAVPEPGSLALLGSSLGALGLLVVKPLRRRRV